MMPAADQEVASEVKWVDGTQIAAWYGLRFASLVTRFQPAKKAEGRLEVKALHEVPVFPQLKSRLSSSMGLGSPNPQSEDAFFLNIWAPAQAKQLPVLVFIHGGAWMTGGSALPWYDGARLAAQGIVVININYRLGALGHLGTAADCSLPVPAHDVLLALEWIAEHVGQYGGDAAHVTLAGQSAGGWYAHLLSVLPRTAHLMQRVALLSMGTRAPWSAQQQAATTSRATAIAGNLLTAQAQQVLTAGLQALEPAPFQLGYAPAAFLPVASQDVPTPLFDPTWAAQHCHAKKVYIRYTKDESASFFFDLPEYAQLTQDQVDAALMQWPSQNLPAVLLREGEFEGKRSGLSPYEQLVAASSWLQFQRFPQHYAQQLQSLGKDVSLRRFNLASPLARLQSGHCFDLPFQFGVRAAWEGAPMLAGLDESTFEKEASSLINELAQFVKSE